MTNLKLYIQTILLLDTLDDVTENGFVEKKLKLRANQLKKEIELFDKEVFKNLKDSNGLDVTVKITEKFNKVLRENLE